METELGAPGKVEGMAGVEERPRGLLKQDVLDRVQASLNEVPIPYAMIPKVMLKMMPGALGFWTQDGYPVYYGINGNYNCLVLTNQLEGKKPIYPMNPVYWEAFLTERLRRLTA